MEILENIPLALYTSIRIGGPARFFCVVKNEQDLNTALEFAREKICRFLCWAEDVIVCFRTRELTDW